jgi:hypothetical protein
VEQRAPGVHQESPALSERFAQFFLGTFEDGEDPKSALGVSKAEQWERNPAYCDAAQIFSDR